MVNDSVEGLEPEPEREPHRPRPMRADGGSPGLPALEHELPVIVLVADADFFVSAQRLLRGARHVDAAWIARLNSDPY